MPQQEISGDSSPRRIHKRTMLIVFFVVVLPWILVAVPGESTGGWGTTGSSREAFVHGWPFVHLDRTQATVSGSWVNKKFFPGRMPAGLDLRKLAKESAREHPALRMDLRLNRKDSVYAFDAANPMLGTYWTNVKLWPLRGPGIYWEIRPLGLICNLLVLGLAGFLIGFIVERRIRSQGRLLKFSLKSLLALMALVSIAIGWVVGEYSRFASLQRDLTNIELMLPSHLNANFEGRFPRVVSQLFNHGHLPFVDPRFFVVLSRRDPGSLWVSLDDLADGEQATAEQIIVLNELNTDARLSIYLETWVYTRQIEEHLNGFDKAQVENLEIQFGVNLWVESFSDVEGYQGDFFKDIELFGKSVNIIPDFPRLKVLRLHLCSELDQQSQLESFCGLESLEEVELSGLSQPAIDFLWKTREKWPRNITLEFEHDVNDESRDRLVQYFGLIYEDDEDAAVPPVSESSSAGESGGVF